MDQATCDLLTRWNLPHYINKFATERIDIATMLLLPKKEVIELFPNIGDRVRFEVSLSMYRDDQTDTVTQTGTVRSDSSPMSESFMNQVLGDGSPLLSSWSDNDKNLLLLTNESPNNIDDEGSAIGGLNNALCQQSSAAEIRRTNSVQVILELSAEGQQILEIGLKAGTFVTTVRGRLCKLLMEKLATVDNPVLPSDAQLLNISNDIGRLFIKESPPLYYAPYLPADAYQSKRNTSGWLVNARRARRAYLVTLGILAKPKSRSRSLPSTPEVSLSSGINLQGLEEGDAGKVQTALEQLSRPSAGPWQEVSILWRETVRARLRYVYYEEGTLQEYFDKYPILQSPDGWRLLISDYEALFPDKTSGLQALQASTDIITTAAFKKKNTTKDKFLRQKIEDTLAICDDANPESKIIAAVLLVGCLFNIPPARRSKKDWQASRAEILDGFVTTIDTEADVQVVVEERRQKLQKLNLSLQPFIIWCRNSGTAFTVCDSVFYKFTSLPEAVDVTFKIFHATGAKYPTESYNVWLIIQKAFYEVTTSYDRLSQSVKEVLTILSVKI